MIKITTKKLLSEITLFLIDQLEKDEVSIDRIKEVSRQILAVFPDENCDQDEFPAEVLSQLVEIPEIKTFFQQKKW